MNQSSTIFAALAIAFVVYITMRGELRTYMGFILGSGCANPSGAVANAGNTVTNGQAANTASTAISAITALAPLV